MYSTNLSNESGSARSRKTCCEKADDLSRVSSRNVPITIGLNRVTSEMNADATDEFAPTIKILSESENATKQ